MECPKMEDKCPKSGEAERKAKYRAKQAFKSLPVDVQRAMSCCRHSDGCAACREAGQDSHRLALPARDRSQTQHWHGHRPVHPANGLPERRTATTRQAQQSQHTR